jgi:hypothetical protein
VGQATLSFAKTFGSHDVRLIELPEDVLKSIEEGETLKIIGPLGDGKSSSGSSSSGSSSSSSSSKAGPTDAVLCTSSKTFTIKKVETSNSVFVIPPSEDGGTDFKIHSLSQFYYELKSAPARTERVAELLRRAEYHGAASEEAGADAGDPSAWLSYDELRAEVQASDEEFAASLFALGVVELRGKMRLLSKTAVREVTRDLIDTLMERGWPIDRVDHQQCLAAMPGTDPVLLEFALKTLGTLIDSGVWALSREAVCQATAHILFNAQAVPSAPWDCDEFRATWEARTPGAAPDEALLLRGIALKVDGKKMPPPAGAGAKGGSGGDGCCYVYLPADSMSGCDVPGRLHQLFQVSPRLQLAQLEPYFLDLVGGTGKPKTVAELLIMSGRVSNVDGYFSSR